MSDTFYLEVVTPERKFYQGNVQSIIVPSIDGEMGVLKGHMKMITATAIGVLKIQVNNEWKKASVSYGFMEVNPDHVTILLDSIEWPEEIDVKRVEESKARAEERLAIEEDRVEYLRTQAAIKRAIARLKVTKNIE